MDPLTLLISAIALGWCGWLIRDAMRYNLLNHKIVATAIMATDNDLLWEDTEKAWKQLCLLCNEVRSIDPNTMHSLLEHGNGQGE